MRAFRPIQPPALQREQLESHYRYREYPPGRGLENHIACYWTLDVRAEAANPTCHRIIPDGCADIIFDLSSPPAAGGAFAVGLMTGYEAADVAGNHSLFGIRFFPEAVRSFTLYPLSEFASARVALEDLWGSDARLVTEQLASAEGTAERIDLIESALCRMLLQSRIQADRLLQVGMQYIYDGRGTLSIRSLADKLHYSERTIRRAFLKELGIGPKELSGIVRFQYVLQELHRGTGDRYAGLAAQYGYSDQPHLIGDFKRYYGMTPTQVFKNRMAK